jgi:hypothetical protein
MSPLASRVTLGSAGPFPCHPWACPEGLWTHYANMDPRHKAKDDMVTRGVRSRVTLGLVPRVYGAVRLIMDPRHKAKDDMVAGCQITTGR